MTQISDGIGQNTEPGSGLRGRKKARRRQEILHCAERLFARDGIDATTMAAIANEADVSPPTIFNYFGSKENILSALIFEGAKKSREQHFSISRKTGAHFAIILGDLLCECTENTMRIAGKRVWRFAEAANIRRPDTEFEKQFVRLDAELLNLIAVFLSDYDLKLRSGTPPDHGFLAKLFFDRWTARYFAYIKDEAMPMDTHTTQLRADVETMVSILFEDAFSIHSPLQKPDIS